MASTVHSFYQNVYLMDNEMNVEMLKTGIEEQKRRVSLVMADNLKLVENNRQLKSVLSRYRGITRDFQVQGKKSCGNSPTGHGLQYLSKTTDKRESSVDYPLPLPSGKDSTKLKQSAEPSEDFSFPTPTVPHTSKENVHLGLMGAALRKISKATSFHRLIDVMYKELAVLLRAPKLGIFLLDPQIRRLFQRERGEFQTMHAGKITVDLATNESTFANYNMRPAFGSYSSAANGIRKADTIVLPVRGTMSSLGEDIYFAVQVEGKTVSNKKERTLGGANEEWVLGCDESRG